MSMQHNQFIPFTAAVVSLGVASLLAFVFVFPGIGLQLGIIAIVLVAVLSMARSAITSTT